MNNADMPAMPLPLGTETTEGCQGLTKREMMAMHIFCSINSAPAEKFNINSASATAVWAVNSADALLAELERACQKT